MSEDGTTARLVATDVDITAPHASPTFVGKRQRLLTGQSSVVLPALTPDILTAWSTARLKCGLAVFKDEHRYTRIFVDASGDKPGIVFELVNNAQKISRTSRHDLPEGSNTLSLRIAYTEQEYRLEYAHSGTWTLLDTVDTLQLTDPDFVGPVVGVFATSTRRVDVQLTSLSID